jgi:hypothetical protein
MLPGGLRDSVDSGRGQKPGRLTIAPAAYDEIADWYEHEFLAATATPGTDPLGIGAALGSLLGRGTGACLGIGCGTGVHAGRSGWKPYPSC